MRTMTRLVATVLAVAWSTAAGADATIQGVGDLPGGNYLSLVQGVSLDGSTVFGVSVDGSPASSAAFRWTEAGSIQALGGDPDGNEAVGATADGRLIAVRSYGSPYEWSLWTEEEGLVPTGDGFATGMSANGAVVSGNGNTGAFRWTETTNEVPLTPVGGYGSALVNAVSADGSFIVGSSFGIGIPDGGTHAARWNEAGVATDLGDLASGPIEAIAYDVSADGSVVVGQGTVESSSSVNPFVSEAFRWTEATGMQGLGFLGDGYVSSSANKVSPDGVLVFGTTSWDYGMDVFVWDARNGMRPLVAVLANEHGLDLTGWSLTRVTGVSADRRTIVGNASHNLLTPPSYQWAQEGYIVRLSTPLPEPGAAALAGVALAALVAVRRRRR